jgi:hypothetical protein
VEFYFVALNQSRQELLSLFFGCLAAAAEGATWPVWAYFMSNAMQDLSLTLHTPDKIEAVLLPTVLVFIYLGAGSSLAQMVRIHVFRRQGPVC